jgi:hypothetical protein
MANDVLRGNFTPKKPVELKRAEETLEDRFEREAQKHLGGSIAYVAKKKVVWDVKE